MGPHVAEPEPSPADAGLDDVVHDVAGWDLDDWVDAETESAPPPLRPAVEPIPAEEPRLSVDLEPDDPALTSGGPVGTAAETTGPVATRAQGAVVYVDDAEAQFEIGRPLHLVLVGWMVNGEVVCGNHRGADLVVPENRIRPDQVLVPCDYFRLRVRGRKGTLEVLARGEVEIDGSAPAASYEDPEAHQIDVIRRDDAGERDFVVGLRLEEDRRLPDPRARFVALDTQEPLAAALVTRGLPKATPRTLELQGMKLTFLFDGAAIRVSDYLATYRRGDTFHPFFVQRGEERFKTAPEDGAAFEVRPGDRLVIGSSVYVLRAE
jgi:hypothetical protein